MAEDKFLLLSHIDDIREAADEVYVAKETGKGLSSNDYTSDDKTKLDGMTAGAQPNVIEGVSVNGDALEVTNKGVNVTITAGETNGTIKVNGKSVSVAGLAALAFKANVSADDLAAELKNLIDGKAEASALTALIGDDANKTIREVAADEVAKIVDGADSDYDTLKEIAEYIASDKTNAANINSDISNLKTKTTLGTHEVEGSQVEYASVKEYVEAVVAALGMENYVEKETGKGLSTNDFTDDFESKLTGIAENAQVNVIESIEVNGVAATISNKAASVTLPTATSSEVKARFAAAGN